ncbi:Cilia- And Flagella-Associated Protein 52 [Manis pentadactyla]|nr:Cilia- And Flagella-Associated Protein 52 [Manis pentadactyla]
MEKRISPDTNVADLELEAIIGFNGHGPTGLKCHPDQEHLVYPLGCTDLFQAINTQEQNFLHGHGNNISCVTISKSRTYIASGQVTFIGFKADIILWDYKKRELIARLSLHKGKVEDLTFSPNDLYLVSLGGPDDGSVVVWSIAKREAICGSAAAGLNVGNTTTVIFSRCRDEMFVTAGKKIQLQGAITSITLRGEGHQFFIGTEESQIYCVNFTDFRETLIATCHFEPVWDIVFPL